MIVLPVKTSQHHCQRSQPVALPWGQTLLSFRSLPSSPDHILSLPSSGLAPRCLGRPGLEQPASSLGWDFPSISIQSVSLALGGPWIQTSHPRDHTHTSFHLVSALPSLFLWDAYYVQSIGPECRVGP